MFVEDLNIIPEPLRGQFEQVEIDGKKGYQDKDSLELKRHLHNKSEDSKKYLSQLKDVSDRLSSFEQQQAEAIKKAREDALAEARTKGDVQEIEKRYQEQMADLKQRSFEEGKAEAAKEFSLQRAQTEAKAAVSDIVAKLKPLDGADSALRIIVQSRQKIGEDGKVFYTNADGGASVLDAAGLIAELQQDAAVKRLIQGQQPTTGGGMANGGSGGGASVQTGKLGGTRQEREAALAQKFNLPIN